MQPAPRVALPGATTAFMIAYDAAITAYVDANAEQGEELEEGMDERVDVKKPSPPTRPIA